MRSPVFDSTPKTKSVSPSGPGQKLPKISKKEINSKEALRRQLIIEKETFRHAEASPKFTWDSTWYYLLCVANTTLGTGNIVTFPRLCYQYEGGTFLVVYFVMMLIFGMPVLYMELLMGQYHRGSLLLIIQRCAPIMQGVGWLAVFTAFLIVIPYQYEVAKIIEFLLTILSIRNQNSYFQSCNNTWNNGACYEFFNEECVKSTNMSHGFYQGSCDVPMDKLMSLESGEIQFLNMVHKKSATILERGPFDRSTFMCLAVAWLTIAMIFNRGLKKIGQTAAVPTVLIFLIVPSLFLVSLKMEGALVGLEQLLVINWKALMSSDIWLEGLQQVGFSFGVGVGCMTAIASFAPPESHTFKILMIDVAMDIVVSLMCTATVFSTLGYMSHKLGGMSIYEIIPKGDAQFISHIVFPVLMRGVSDQASVWILTYYTVMILLGWGTAIQITLSIVTAISDGFNVSSKTYKFDLISVVVCIFCLAFGALLCFDSGDHWATLLFNTGSTLQYISMLFIMIVICDFYGIANIYEDIQVMMGRPVLKFWGQIGYISPLWRPLWRHTPAFSALVVIMTSFQDFWYPENTPGYPYVYEMAKVTIMLSAVMLVPIFMIYSTLVMKNHMVNVEKKKFNWRIMFMKQKQLRCWNRVMKHMLAIDADSSYELFDVHLEKKNEIEALLKMLPDNPPNDVQGFWRLANRPFWKIQGPKVKSHKAQRMEDYLTRMTDNANMQAFLTGTQKPAPVPKDAQPRPRPLRKPKDVQEKTATEYETTLKTNKTKGDFSSASRIASSLAAPSPSAPEIVIPKANRSKRKKRKNTLSTLNSVDSTAESVFSIVEAASNNEKIKADKSKDKERMSRSMDDKKKEGKSFTKTEMNTANIKSTENRVQSKERSLRKMTNPKSSEVRKSKVSAVQSIKDHPVSDGTKNGSKQKSVDKSLSRKRSSRKDAALLLESNTQESEEKSLAQQGEKSKNK